MTTDLVEVSTQFSTREVPWMKLGKLVDKPLTAAEAAKESGLDFIVERRPLWFGDHEDFAQAAPTTRVYNRVGLINKNTGELLSIVSKEYPILQYGEAFDFMDNVNPTYVAAGALKGGKQGFMVVKAPMNELLTLNEIDPHDLYIVLRTSHDCSRAVEASVMALRNRCMNQMTLRTFGKGAHYRWTIKHTSTMKAKLAEAQKSLTNLGFYAQGYETTANKLINTKITDDKAENILMMVLPDRPRRNEQIEKIKMTWHNSETVGKEFDYTGWGLLNAVSDYFEWGRAGGSPESRFLGALQGSTHRTINKTSSLLLTL